MKQRTHHKRNVWLYRMSHLWPAIWESARPGLRMTRALTWPRTTLRTLWMSRKMLTERPQVRMSPPS